MHARPTRTRTRRSLGALTLAAALAVTAACGSDDPASQSSGDSSQGSGSASSSAAAEHNDADVAFASDMLAHHAQAIEMVDMTQGRTLDPKVAKLADQIKAAQAPEIDTFTTWLKQWGEKVPDTSGGHDMSDMDSMGSGGSGDGSGMAGMMSEADMTNLENSADSEFQDMWLEMMIEHHEGAVEMAKTETADGKYEPATKLAEQIATSQTTEIDTMKKLLS